MEDFVVDIETDGLNATIIHLAVVRNVETNNVYVFTDSDHNDFAGLVAGHRLIGHNIISFDLPVLEKLWGYKHDGEVVDTLVLSRLFNPSREGGHSLRAWGETLGFPKGDFNDWSKLTPEMVEYCKQDTAVTAKVYEVLRKEGVGFADTSIDLEHRVAAIIAQQQKNGWLVDERAAYILLAELQQKREEIEQEVHKTFRPIAKKDKEIELVYKKDGTLNSRNLRWLVDWNDVVVGNFTRIQWQEFNLGSRKQIAERLINLGWKPQEFTDKGSPIVDEKQLENVEGIPEVTLIKQFLMLQKREAMLSSWIDKIEEDGRVHGQMNTIGTPTGRATHSNPNFGQIISNRHEWGPEMRKVWTAPEGSVLVDADLASLEQRMLAHYMAKYDNGDYSNVVLTKDIHSYNQEMAGLETRDQAKTLGFCLIYGGGDDKVGKIVGGGAREGKKLKERYFKELPAFGSLYNAVRSAASRGYLKGLDGRKIFIRSEHSALNYLLQSAGAVVSKVAIVEYQRILKEEHGMIHGKDYKQVAWIHDAITCEVPEEKSDVVGNALVQAFKNTTDILNLRCPQDGKYLIGKTFADVH